MPSPSSKQKEIEECYFCKGNRKHELAEDGLTVCPHCKRELPNQNNKLKEIRQEGIYKMLNGTMEKLNHKLFIVEESWRKTKARLQEQYPTAKIKYSYKTKQFLISFPLPSDYYNIKSISISHV